MGQSEAWLDEFLAWKTFGGKEIHSLPARTVDAFCILEREWTAERLHANE